jgi:RHS repeat-associated protein
MHDDLNGRDVQLIYDGDRLIAEYWDGRLAVQVVHDDGLDQPVQIAVRPSAVGDGSESWYHEDLLGSIRLMTDGTGAVSAAYEYSPYGRLLSPLSPGPYNSLLYTAQRFDEPLDTYDMRARQYDPSVGRFQQRDQIGTADGPNLYAYTRNSPLGLLDPYGTEGRSDRDSPTPAEIHGYFQSQREHLAKVQERYTLIKGSDHAFAVYRDILDELEGAAIAGRPINLNRLWEKARRYSWSWDDRFRPPGTGPRRRTPRPPRRVLTWPLVRLNGSLLCGIPSACTPRKVTSPRCPSAR